MKESKFAALFAVAVIVSSCVGNLEEKVSVKGVELSEINGLSSIVIDFQVDNASRYNISLNELDIVVNDRGRAILKAKLMQCVTLDKRSEGSHSTQWALSTTSLLGGMGAVMKLLKAESFDGYTIDYSLEAKAGVFKRSFTQESVPIGKLVENYKL